MNYGLLIGYNRKPEIKFEFDKKKYLPIDSHLIQLSDQRLPTSSNYKNVVNQMFEDLLTDVEKSFFPV